MVVRIRQNACGGIDLHHLEAELKEAGPREIIGSFSAASNVTGTLTDVDAVSALVHRYGGFAFFDYACAGPYVDIDMNPTPVDNDDQMLVYKDAVFISPHKFIGGPGTSGVLVAKRGCFRNEEPYNDGGGTVAFVTRHNHTHVVNPESREGGGTQNILGDIRAGLVFQLKRTFTPSFIMLIEDEMWRQTLQEWRNVPNLIILGNLDTKRLPIFPMLFYNPDTGRFLHHDFVAMLMNDVFGIQVRSGCACAGPYGLDLFGMSEKRANEFKKLIAADCGGCDAESDGYSHKKKYSSIDYRNAVFKPGFVRLNIPYFVSDDTLKFVHKAVKVIAENAWKLLPSYDFDQATGKWTFKGVEQKVHRKQLQSISFAPEQQCDGHNKLKRIQKQSRTKDMEDSLGSESKAMYKRTLKHGTQLFKDAKYAPGDQHARQPEVTDHALRWFMLPEEAAAVLAGRAVTSLPVEQLPFFPGALARKLGVGIVGHEARGDMDEHCPLEFY